MKALTYLLCLVTCFWSCKSNEPDPLIVGQWLWQQSSGGIAGWTIKPKNNERVVLGFSREGTFSVKQNDSLRLSGSYHLGKIKSIYTSGEATGIYLDNIVNHEPKSIGFPLLTGSLVITKLTTQELEVGDNVYDGYGSSFNRIE